MSNVGGQREVDVAGAWRDALAALEVRHPNGRSRIIIQVHDGVPATLYVGLDVTACTLTGEDKYDLPVSNFRLMYWPGVRAAQAWFAAMWASYLQHEVLELVTLAGDHAAKILDPHAEPYAINPYNRCLRDGLPGELTPEALRATLRLVMDDADAVALMEAST